MVLGIGTKPFKEKGKIYSKVFDEDMAACYNKTITILRELKATPYRGSLNKRFIVALHFHNSFPVVNETTEVAVFFKNIDGKTNVEVSSLNYSLSEFAAEKIFSGLTE